MPIRYALLLVAAVLLGFAPAVQAQTTLGPGNLVVVQANADDTKDFSFVTLIDLDANTTVRLTDNGWQASGSFRTGEGTLVWTATSGVAAGTIVTFTNTSSSDNVSVDVGSVVTDGGAPNLASNGDALLLYQGPEAAPQFIYALSIAGAVFTDATTAQTSAVPAGLRETITAVVLNNFDDNGYAGTTTGTAADLIAAIAMPSNWTGSNTILQAPPTGPFTVQVPTTTVSQTLADAAGYRLLSTPVTGVSVGDLAVVNLVQGVPAGGGNAQQQYPDAQTNFYIRYTGVTNSTFGTYDPAPNTGFVVEPGRGFFWQFYDQAIPPQSGFGGGTSQSYELPAQPLSVTGPAPTSTFTRSFAATPDKFYMVGNPFARNLAASAITVQGSDASTGGIQGQVLQAYRPSDNTFVTINQMDSNAALAVWQGVFAQTIDPAAPTFVFDATAPIPGSATFIGRAARVNALALTLTGTTASGASTRDEAAIVRFADSATAGWDAFDASKLTPPAGPFALVAPVLERDGAAHRAAVSTIPLAEALVPLSLIATDPGTYTLTADVSGLPQGWTAEIRDVTTGARADLASGYTFTTDATNWTDRFELSVRPGAATAGESAPAAFALGTPSPNPATSQATLALRVDAAQRVTATLVDALGRTVATVFDGDIAAGAERSLVVSTRWLAPGVYVVRVQGATFAETRRLTVVR